MAVTAARAVCIARDMELPHVWQAVGECLDHSRGWTLERAASHGHKRLVQHLALQRTQSAHTGMTRDPDHTGDGDADTEADTDDCHSLVMDFAARSGHLEILQWLHGTEALSRCSTRSLDDAAKNGHLAIVQWLHTHRKEGGTSKAMDAAAMNGHLHVVAWLHEHRKDGCTTRAMDLAAQNGHLAVLQWLAAKRSEGCSSLAVEYAATEGHLHVVRWLCEQHRALSLSLALSPSSRVPPAAMIRAARRGHVAVLEYLGAKFPAAFEDAGARMVQAAIANGHVALMTWLISVLPVRALKGSGESDSDSWLNVAAEFGHVAILQWFADHTSELPVGVLIDGHLPACSAEAVGRAAGNGHLEALRFLHNHGMVSIREQDEAVRALQAAVVGGHRDSVAWMVQHLQRFLAAREIATAIMDAAAAAGHVEVLAFLRGHAATASWRTSAKAVNEASRQGLLSVLQWVHAHDSDNSVEADANDNANTSENENENEAVRHERWTPRALESAAANGHVEVVAWLLANRCTECRGAEALNAAAYMDHLALAQLLYTEIRSSCSVVQALEHAEEGGAEDTLAWLQSLSPQDRP